MSYGCSTGEECASLEHYFPHAAIVGADINPVCVMDARKAFPSPRLQFVYAKDRTLRHLAPFDVIFCMAVLRVPAPIQERGNIAQDYPFDRFVERVQFLDSLLCERGLLIIHKALYRFCDTTLSARYQTVPVTYAVEVGDHHYLRNGEALSPPYLDVVFRKLAQS